MDKNKNSTITRRQLMQFAAASGLYLALPGIGSCSSLPKYQTILPDKGKTLKLINCHIVDVVDGSVHKDKTISVRNGIIEAIEDNIPAPAADLITVDMKKQYLIPGLIDAHCHSTLSSESAFNLFGLMTTMRQIKINYTQQLRNGVTTIRDMGALPKMLHDNLELIEKGELAGPRIVYCNSFTNIKGGHPDVDPADVSIFSGLAMMFGGNPNLYFRDNDELREKMKINSSGGVSFIKLSMDNKSLMCGKGDIPVYTDEQLNIILEFARKNNLATAGHIHSKFGFDRAVQFGINSMEHAIADAVLTRPEIDEMARKKIAIVPTMIIAQMLAAEEAYNELPKEFQTDFIKNELTLRRQYLNSNLNDYIDPDIHQSNMKALGNYKKYGCENMYRNGKFMAKPDIYFNILLRGPQNLLKMKEAGIVIGCGTDSGVPPMYHGSLHREMEMLCRIGFSNSEALGSATINNANILRMADKIGSLEKGKFADIVALKENPLEKIEACREPQLVIKGGCIYDFNKKL